MSTPEPPALLASSTAEKRMRCYALVALALVWLLLEPPWTFVFPSSGLDPSWELASVVATLKGAQWGKDFVFTCGPLAWLSTRWYVPTPVALFEIGFHVALDLLTFACLIRLAGWRLGVPLGVVAVFVFGNIPETQFYLIGPLAAMLLLIPPESRVSDEHRSATTGANVALALALAGIGGIAALSKLSFAPAMTFSFAAIDAERLLKKHPPSVLPLFLASAAISWFASGQHAANIGAFLVGTSEIISGYPDAMGLPGSNFSRTVFVLSGIALTGVAMVAAKRTKDSVTSSRVLLPLVLAANGFVVYRAAFTRESLVHAAIGWSWLGLVAAIWLARAGATHSNDPTIANRALPPPQGKLTTGLVLCACALAITASAIQPQGSFPAPLTRSFPNNLIRNATTLIELVTRPVVWWHRLDLIYRASLDQIARNEPLPSLEGSVDSIPSLQAEVIANGWSYSPRPVTQEYSTYTPQLLALDYGFFDRTPPDKLLLAPSSFDDRWPMLSEGPLWPLFVSIYEPMDEDGRPRLVGNAILLQRRPTRRPLPDAKPFAAIDGTIGVAVAIPPASTLFARITIHKSISGEIETMLAAPPVLYISAKLADGRGVHHRLIPGIASEGFVLSPYLSTGADALSLWAGDSIEPGGNRVVEITLEASPNSGFKPKFQIELSHVSLSDP